MKLYISGSTLSDEDRLNQHETFERLTDRTVQKLVAFFFPFLLDRPFVTTNVTIPRDLF